MALVVGMALAGSWLTKSSWRREESQAERVYDVNLYVELAQKAEQHKLDFVFCPDTLFINAPVLAKEPGFSSLDPMLLLSVVASATESIGLVGTVSTTFNPPYVTARQLQTLQWISKGRLGWNIVTAIDGQRNFGESDMLPSAQRYAKAQEFTDVVKKLWRSFPHQSLKVDRSSGKFAETEQIKTIDHQGEYFAVEGPINLPESPYGDIAFFQAGASDVGRQFAARNANAVFAATPDVEAGIELKQDMVNRAIQSGRSENDIKVLPGISLYLGDTREEAEALYLAANCDVSIEKRLEYLAINLQTDFNQFGMEQRITRDLLPESIIGVRSQTHTDLLLKLIERETPQLKDLLDRPEVIGSSHWLVVGTAEDAYQQIADRVKAGAADGIIAVPGGSLRSVEIFFEQLVPLLKQNKLMKEEYQSTNLKQRLIQAG